jgi:hypothetical protein
MLIQPAHARQPTCDRARRQTGLAVLQPRHPLAAAGARWTAKNANTSAGAHCDRLTHHLEENLQVERDGQPRVHPRPSRCTTR